MRSTPSLRYRYAGRRISSTLPLQELAIFAADVGKPDVSIVVLEQPPAAPDSVDSLPYTLPDQDGNVAIHGERWSDGSYCLRFAEAATARIRATGRRIEVWTDPDASEEAVRHVLLDQILPRAIALSGCLVLHASAVLTTDGRMLALLGRSGMGKSTLAAAFDLHGGQALTDDCLVVECRDKQVFGHPGYPGLRLWPDTIDALLEHRRNEATAMVNFSEKLRIATTTPRTHPQANRLDAIIVLQEPNETIELVMNPLSPHSACMALVANSFQMDPGDLGQAQLQLRLAAEVTRSVPVLTLAFARDYKSLPGFITEICRRLNRLLV